MLTDCFKQYKYGLYCLILLTVPRLKMKDQFVTIKEIYKYFGISRTTLWRIRKDDKTFPKCLPTGKKWKLSNIEEWLNTKTVHIVK